MTDQIYEYYRTKSKEALVAKITKRNIKKVSEWISDRLDVEKSSVINGMIYCETGGSSFVAEVGEYIVMNHEQVRTMSKHQLECDYRKEFHSIPSYYTPSESQVKIIKVLDDELYWGYDYICSESDLERSEAKAAIDTLRQIGVVDYARGLMNDDGEVGGSGFAILDRIKAEALLYRYYGDNDDC